MLFATVCDNAGHNRIVPVQEVPNYGYSSLGTREQEQEDNRASNADRMPTVTQVFCTQRITDAVGEVHLSLLVAGSYIQGMESDPELSGRC